jgi:hypothetical protein
MSEQLKFEESSIEHDCNGPIPAQKGNEMTIHAKSLADLLLIQDHYYAPHDGVKYAKRGTEEDNGLLVFETRERADRFCQTVAFQPVRVDSEELLRLFQEVGAICVAQGRNVVVATLKPGRAKASGTGDSVNPEGVVPEDSNWEPAK